MKPVTHASADLILTALEDVRLMLANWPTDKPEMKARLKELRREMKAAAKIVAACVQPDLFQ